MMRIDAWHRIDPTTDRLTVNYNGGGDTVVTLTEANHETLASLCAHIQTRLVAVIAAGMQCADTDGIVTIRSAGPSFTVTWTRPALRDWLGYTGNLSGAGSYLAPNTCRGTFVATLPWRDDVIGLSFARKAWSGQRGIGGSVRLATARHWRLTAVFDAPEEAQFNIMLDNLLKGIPCSWFRNDDDTAAWSYANFDGVVRCALSQRDASVGWVSPTKQLLMEHQLRFQEIPT